MTFFDSVCLDFVVLWIFVAELSYNIPWNSCFSALETNFRRLSPNFTPYSRLDSMLNGYYLWDLLGYNSSNVTFSVFFRSLETITIFPWSKDSARVVIFEGFAPIRILTPCCSVTFSIVFCFGSVSYCVWGELRVNWITGSFHIFVACSAYFVQ